MTPAPGNPVESLTTSASSGGKLHQNAVQLDQLDHLPDVLRRHSGQVLTSSNTSAPAGCALRMRGQITFAWRVLFGFQMASVGGTGFPSLHHFRIVASVLTYDGGLDHLEDVDGMTCRS
jgi:hypothetical protein